jgi:type IV fimbrial biogenesis protein FimT
MRQAHGNNMNKKSGFTIIEVLIAVAIAVVLLTLGLPSFADFINTIRLTSGVSDLRADLLLARSESIRRNARVLLCPRSSATATTCATAITTATWMNGWLVCYDVDANGACDAATASDPNPVRVRKSIDSPLVLSGPAATVTFFPAGNSGGAATFTLTSGTRNRSLGVAPSGALTSS